VKLALRELRRRPSRFLAAAGVLTLISLLLMFLGGLLDGLVRNATGAVRAQPGGLLVFSADAQDSFLRSRIAADIRARIEAVPGVERAAGIGIVQLGARVPGAGPRELADVALFGYEWAPSGVPGPPADGETYADSSLRADGVREGMQLQLGPARTPVTVVGFVEDTNYLGQGGLWASPRTWRDVLDANRPAQRLPEGVFQSLVVGVDADASPGDVAAAIAEATGGAARARTRQQAADALPGVADQRRVFNQIIGVTVVIALVVVGLFFALVTVERTALYGVLKAVGARSATLFGGLVVQACTVTLVASVVAGGLALALDASLPPGSIPLSISAWRLGTSVALMLAAAVVGCAFSLRRVLRVDPASAIGSAG
jgi:putative ABC transport system permease protein